MSADNNDKISVKSIRITLEDFENKAELKEINKPLEIEVEFSNNPYFIDAVKFKKELSIKKFTRKINRKFYIEVYKGKGILCKYIKIKILKTSNDNETVRISDIQILE